MSRKFSRALIFINGDEEDFAYTEKYIDNSALLIGCDGGADKVYELGLKPDAVIGDFDSIKSLPKKIKNLPVKDYGKEVIVDNTVYIKYPSEKDFLDVEAAIDYALDKGIKEIILFNTDGDELDHVIGVMMVIAKRKYRSINIKVIRPKLTAYAVCGKAEINGKVGNKISLIPLYGRVEVESSSGLKYDPKKHRMSLEHNIGISNELTDKKATLLVRKGCFLVIQYY